MSGFSVLAGRAPFAAPVLHALAGLREGDSPVFVRVCMSVH